MSKIYEQLQPVVSALDNRISEVEERAVTVDSSLSATSTNPVQNKVITLAANQMNNALLGKIDETDTMIDCVKNVVDDISTGVDGTIYPSAGDAVRGQVGKLNSAFNLFLSDNNNLSMWESGGIIVGNGNNTNSGTRIRTKSFLDRGVAKITPKTGWDIALFGYDNNEYVGCWNGQAWQTSALKWMNETIDVSAFTYKLRAVLREHTNATIDTSSYNNVTLLTITDGTLSIQGVPADAKAVGEVNTYITPEQFGAIGDGITNDTASWQSCIDYASSHHLAIKCKCNKTYAVTRLIIVNWRNIDFNFCVLKSAYEAGTDAGQIPLIFVDNTNQSHNVTGADPVNEWHGTIKNVILDGNNATRMGFRVEYDWRGCYENIYVRNLHPGASDSNLAVAYYIEKCNGGTFRNLRARGSNSGYEMFMRMGSPDFVVDTVDFQAFRYGVYVGGRGRFINIHGYIGSQEIYEGSYFMYLRESVVASMLYPDTQQNPFIIARSNAYSLSNIEIAFNGDVAVPTEDQGYVFFVDENAGGSVENVRVTNALLTLPVSVSTAYRVCNVNGLPIYASVLQNVGEYPIVS